MRFRSLPNQDFAEPNSFCPAETQSPGLSLVGDPSLWHRGRSEHPVCIGSILQTPSRHDWPPTRDFIAHLMLEDGLPKLISSHFIPILAVPTWAMGYPQHTAIMTHRAGEDPSLTPLPGYRIVEVNARLSRSSALASKAAKSSGDGKHWWNQSTELETTRHVHGHCSGVPCAIHILAFS